MGTCGSDYKCYVEMRMSADERRLRRMIVEAVEVIERASAIVRACSQELAWRGAWESEAVSFFAQGCSSTCCYRSGRPA